MDPEFQRILERTRKERAQYFTPRWFARLFAARLNLPDTFWLGLLGPLLVAVPVMVVLAMLSKGADPAASMPVFSGLTAVLGLYWALVSRSVLIVARRAPQAGGWRWAAVVTSVAMAALALIGGLRGLL
ncbi:hypothetical protein U879_19780 [Defluviimonas sp. 20V17]|uniref:Uncharacterized protein n=1 Tax=Allgaiera indica TaxID=765699 RepID=A0AAN4USX5_9RHOB|nr:hypothetical protein [Allgaiera indica]KDB01953.1 hypothetical protein U879_19780 [Defluviimonas sp. 20V17]GHE03365.1 hypothetical protein GCM10008024_26330 [Allgaiera indica]SDX24087.1 hypothetical protein SAMN05444006_11272 [Allgaiera indica]